MRTAFQAATSPLYDAQYLIFSIRYVNPDFLYQVFFHAKRT
jgi:hypothetical protein